MLTKAALFKKAHDAILNRIGAMHVNDIMEEMGYDVDEMAIGTYLKVKKAIEAELTFVYTLIERN